MRKHRTPSLQRHYCLEKTRVSNAKCFLRNAGIDYNETHSIKIMRVLGLLKIDHGDIFTNLPKPYVFTGSKWPIRCNCRHTSAHRAEPGAQMVWSTVTCPATKQMRCPVNACPKPAVRDVRLITEGQPQGGAAFHELRSFSDAHSTTACWIAK
jgi:hypothetical protein